MYAVTFRQQGSCLGGTLTDTGIPNGPQTGPVFGTVNDDNVTFSFTYTYRHSHQGTRTFTGTVGRRGFVSGTWDETGREGLSGTWSLAGWVNRACPPFVLRQDPRAECSVR
ncbi:MAG: hypothetical protein ABSB59_11135 [Streptosporangiaceae bacterium]